MTNEIGHSGVFQRRVKRTQALVETNLPGRTRPTGVLGKLGSRPVSQLPDSTLGGMPQKTQRVQWNNERTGSAARLAESYRSNNSSICLFLPSIFSGPFQTKHG